VLHLLCSFSLQIIQVNLTQENLQPIKVGKSLELTYAVEWVETNITFARRFDAYLDYPFFEHQVNPSVSCLNPETLKDGPLIRSLTYAYQVTHMFVCFHELVHGCK
jgi:hypothetical protein